MHLVEVYPDAKNDRLTEQSGFSDETSCQEMAGSEELNYTTRYISKYIRSYCQRPFPDAGGLATAILVQKNRYFINIVMDLRSERGTSTWLSIV